MNISNIFSTAPEFIIDNISIQGYSHKIIDKECQDNSLSWKGNNYAAIIVCDGHGGDKYIRSATGSSFACKVGKEKISEFMDKIGNDESKIKKNLERLEYSIVGAWRECVETDYSKDPIDTDERFEKLEDSDKSALLKNTVKAYGSTFIAAVITKNYCFVIKLGDGNAVLFCSNGTSKMPEELVDDDLQFNITTSLCNSDAALCFRHYFKMFSDDSKVTGIVLTSDGIINSYKTEEAYISFIENVYFAYGEDTVEIAKNELLPVLDTLSEKGSGDDLSVSIARSHITKEEKKAIKRKQEQEKIDFIRLEAEKKVHEAELTKDESKKAKAETEVQFQKDNQE